MPLLSLLIPQVYQKKYKRSTEKSKRDAAGQCASQYPASCVLINLYRLHGRRYPLIPHTFSLFTFTYYFERSETTPQSRLRRASFPAGEPMDRQVGRLPVVPLARQRCVESPHPTKCVSINLYRLHGRRYPLISRTFSLFTSRADDIRPYLL